MTMTIPCVSICVCPCRRYDVQASQQSLYYREHVPICKALNNTKCGPTTDFHTTQQNKLTTLAKAFAEFD